MQYHHSLRFRLTALLSLVLLVAILSASLLQGWRAFDREVEAHRARLAGLASGYSAAMSDAVAARDRPETLKVLRGMRQLPSVSQGDITIDGRPFAQMGTGAMLVGRDGNPDNMSLWQIWSAGQLRVEIPIEAGARTVGQLGLLTDISPLRRAVIAQFRDTVVIGMIALIVGIVLAQILIARLTKPLLRLSQQMQSFGASGEMGDEIVVGGKDETGVLALRFNQMIADIRSRDQALSRHMETLEDTVDARTRELRKAKDLAEAATAAKSDFLATMSHEIRTPMNGMLVMADMLSAADLTPRHRRYADIISRSGRSLLTIINDILDLSKIESGRLDLERLPIDLDALVCDVAALFWERAREGGLDLGTFVAPSVPQKVYGDPTRLNQVLTNLVNNALKFTETGGVTLSVDCLATTPDGRARLVFCVTDTGIGIPEDKLETIFNSFSQADQSTTRRFGGTGLGLAVCKRLADAMDADLSVTSTEGEGSSFRFEVELDAANSGQPALPTHTRIALDLSPGPARHALQQSLEAAGAIVTSEQPQAILVSSARFDQARATQSDSAVVIVSDLGDAKLDDALRSGAAKDMLGLPASRGEISSLLQRIAHGSFLGADALRQGDIQASHPDLGGLRVLAVDDNAVNREVLSEALRTLNARVVFAVNGADAVKAVEGARYDAILMDGSMPVMDGKQATREIRAYESRNGLFPSRIIALTAQIGEQDERDWHAAGADDHIAKPFRIDALAAALDGLNPCGVSRSGNTVSPEEDMFDAATLDSLKAMSPDDPCALRDRVWSMFADRGEASVKACATALDESPRAVARAAHALKSAALSAGAAKVAKCANRLEQLGKDEADRPAMARTLLELVHAMELTLSAIRAELADQESSEAA